MIRLKKFIFTIYALCGMSLFAIGQNTPSTFEKIESQKAAYVTQQLNLTSSDAQRFFPIYNQYIKELRAIKAAKSDVNLSGRDMIEFDAKEVELKKRYRSKFAEVIGISRASQFFVVEQEFKDMLYKEWQSRSKR